MQVLYWILGIIVANAVTSILMMLLGRLVTRWRVRNGLSVSDDDVHPIIALSMIFAPLGILMGSLAFIVGFVFPLFNRQFSIVELVDRMVSYAKNEDSPERQVSYYDLQKQVEILKKDLNKANKTVAEYMLIYGAPKK